MKLKRLLTAALSAVMALSVCALPAMAEGTTSTSTFDPSITKGTLTIKKYEQTDADKTKTDADEKKENRWMALNSLFISWQLLSKYRTRKIALS